MNVTYVVYKYMKQPQGQYSLHQINVLWYVGEEVTYGM
jgi:hypothetical protein